MFDSLTKNLSKSFEVFNRKKIISESDIQDSIKEVRMALLEADVAYSVVEEFCLKVSQQAVGEKVTKNVSPGEQFIKIVQDEIEDILGKEQPELDLSSKKDVVLMIGLQGSGKTTSSAKLAKFLEEKKGKKVLLASTDIYRPAAQEQLAIMAERAGVDSLEIVPKEKPEKITKRALKKLKKENYDCLIIDSAGRLSIDDELIKELKNIKKIADPSEILFVADAISGQDAVLTAKNFNEKIGITGLIFTRVDGDQRGGAVLSVKYETGAPIKFLGVGEDIKDFEVFSPDRVASRILDMGDIVGLVEKAQEVVSEEDAKELEGKFMAGRLDLEDLLKQFKTMKKMGGLGSLVSMIPGAGKIKDAMNSQGVDDKSITHQEAIILSMTKFERRNPEKLNTSRKKRVARGSGTSIQMVNQLLKRLKMMQKMARKFGGMDQQELMGMMGGGLLSII
jgi:signal recognition particle subunit SRP54